MAAPLMDADDILRMIVVKLKQKRQRASDLFKSIDTSGDGSLEAPELRVALQTLGINASDEEFALLMAKIDKDGGGDVSLKEFDRAIKAAEKLPPKKKEEVVVTKPKKKQGLTAEDKEEIRQIFCVFKQLCRSRNEAEAGGSDAIEWDDSGTISTDELEQLFETVGMNLEPAEFEEMIRQVDKDNNGEIDFGEFCDTMTKQIQVEFAPEDIGKAFKSFSKGAPEGLIRVKDLGNAMKIHMHKELSAHEVDDLVRHYSNCFVKIPGSDEDYFNYQDYIDLMAPLVPE
eukprot:TRINITY_DN48792_c0_g1_i1.p1 TRINITY_DN48792_c0_g1~~TRINITY_DN48792_c0_g1_i1.p1  ORF type:complete len:316 (-),score=108.81 TRINITY_DN48792_c0_g1_i1:85-942(-)